METAVKTIIKSQRLNEEFIKINHKSGLTVLLYPMKGYSSAYALFGTKYGSIDRTFKTDKDSEFVTVPDGIAHFLEHKLFENEEGDAFSLFAKTGASANAYTSFDRTCYLFSCADNFKESLKILLSFVRSPYFSPETIEKEQGIIGQEIRMYDDNPGWRVFFNLLQALYCGHPVKIDIPGTVESIAEIDKDLLYRCYKTFYNLNNMVLAISGNFNVDEALEVIDETISADEQIEIKRSEYDEPLDISEKEVVCELEVSMPLFTIGYKLPPCEGVDEIRAQIEADIICGIAAGESSELYRRLYDSGLINNSFGSEILSGLGYFCIVFQGESRDPHKVYDEIQAEFSKLREKGIDPKEFEIIKKALYGHHVRSFNNVERVSNNLVLSHFTNTNIYDTIEASANVTIEEVTKRLEQIDGLRSSISIVNPISK